MTSHGGAVTVFGPRSGKDVEEKLNVLYKGIGSNQPHADATQTQTRAEQGASGDASMQRLNELNLKFTSFQHPHASTVEAWKPYCDEHAPNALLCKNLFCKAKKKDTLVLVTALADTVVSLSMVEKHLQVKNLRMARPETLTETLGLQGGAVTSLGLINDKEHRVHVYFDRAMIAAGKVNDILVHPTSGNDITLAISAPALLSYVASCGHTAHLMDFDTGDVVDA